MCASYHFGGAAPPSGAKPLATSTYSSVSVFTGVSTLNEPHGGYSPPSRCSLRHSSAAPAVPKLFGGANSMCIHCTSVQGPTTVVR